MTAAVTVGQILIDSGRDPTTLCNDLAMFVRNGKERPFLAVDPWFSPLVRDRADRAGHDELGSVAGAALYADGYGGHARMVVDEDRGVVVGATFVGSGAGELLHAATVAVVGEIPLDRLWHAVPSYPTMSEVWLRLLEAYGL